MTPRLHAHLIHEREMKEIEGNKSPKWPERDKRAIPSRRLSQQFQAKKRKTHLADKWLGEY